MAVMTLSVATESEIARTWSALADPQSRQSYILAQYRLSRHSDQLIQELKKEVSRLLRTNLATGALLASELLDLVRDNSNPLHRGWALIAMGNSLMECGDYVQSLNVLAEAKRYCLEAGAPVEAARTAISGMHCLHRLGRFEDAIAVAAAARQTFTEHAAWELLMGLEHNLAEAWRRQGRYVEALAALDRALQAARQARGDVQVYMIDQARGINLRYLGRYREALVTMQRARAESEQRGQLLGVARCEQAMGVTYYLMGQYDQALRLLDRARTTFNELASDGPDVLEVELLSADALLALNRNHQVRETCGRIHDRLASRGMVYEVAWTRYVEGMAALRMGDFDSATDLLAEARGRFAALSAVSRLAELDLIEAELSLTRGDLVAARTLSEQARSQFEALGQRIHVERSRLLSARALHMAGDVTLATEAYRQVMTVAASEDIPWLAHPCHYYLGRIHQDAGFVEIAITHYEAAIRQIERLRGTLAVEQRSTFLEDKAGPYGALVHLCMSINQPEKALYTAERAKSRALVELLAGGISLNRYEQDEVTTHLAQRLTDLQATYRNLHRSLIQPNRPLTADEPQRPVSELQTELQRCEREITEMSDRLQMRTTAGTAEVTAGAVTVIDARPALQPDEQIVEYFLADERFVAFVISPERVISVVLPATPDQIERQLRFLRLDFARTAAGRSSHLSQSMAVLAGLYDELWRPLLPFVRAKSRVTIVPHGLLHYLPFHALQDGQAYLLERHELNYLPCSSLLGWCRRPVEKIASHTVALGNSLGGWLPQAEHEARRVAEILGGQCWCNEEATLAHLQAVAGDAGVIHLACHGEFRADAPLFSTLSLADGPLTTAAIFDLRLSAQLVTLSACESGNSLIGGGDELIGLSRAWLYAGARTLVSTLWRVSDEATAQLMIDFYTALSAGRRRSAALRQAQLALLNNNHSAWRHPYFWAPFYLIGDNRPLYTNS